MVKTPSKRAQYGLYRILLEGLLGGIEGVLTMAHMAPERPHNRPLSGSDPYQPLVERELKLANINVRLQEFVAETRSKCPQGRPDWLAVKEPNSSYQNMVI